ncbi:hypothetical protein GCM10010967_58030 [Dyadobacter beijingensis]|uniref:Uncharacterized protein n=1 Tax=Dyadobacter beijingensis TaxID=365489 RepID=A0ABQ2IMM0_9BACT|nr:hypothetical protein GCM10010967_58030 [Dyadobacter beijingensis]
MGGRPSIWRNFPKALFSVLQYSEWINDDRKFEYEQAAIERDGPTLKELSLGEQ